MTPDQAVEAARALHARLLVPIHYNATFEHPEYYRPDRGAREKIEALAEERGVSIGFPAPGDWTDVRAGAEAA